MKYKYIGDFMPYLYRHGTPNTPVFSWKRSILWRVPKRQKKGQSELNVRLHHKQPFQSDQASSLGRPSFHLDPLST